MKRLRLSRFKLNHFCFSSFRNQKENTWQFSGFKSTRCDNENNVTRSFRKRRYLESDMLACHGMILWLLNWQHSRAQCLSRLSTLSEILDRMFKMKGFLAFVLCLVAASGYVLKFGEYDAEWLAWKSFHNKKYETQREEDARYTIWADNLDVSSKFSFFKWMDRWRFLRHVHFIHLSMLKKISVAATEDLINICLSVHLEGVRMGSVEQVFETNLMSHLFRFGSVQFPPRSPTASESLEYIQNKY